MQLKSKTFVSKDLSPLSKPLPSAHQSGNAMLDSVVTFGLICQISNIQSISVENESRTGPIPEDFTFVDYDWSEEAEET